MHFFTSITANYIPKARILAKSVKEHNPGASFHLMISDAVPEKLKNERDPFDHIITPENLAIPNLPGWIFKHSVVELCTAVKGAAFHWIFENTRAEKVVYLDPDIVVLYQLSDLDEILSSHSIVLTPHLVEPEQNHDAIMDNEICSLKHGVFNLGFLGLRKDKEGMRFLNWWRDRLFDYCYDDIPGGIFTDQRWVDLAPCFFDSIRILRDKSYNVATWNLTHRPVLKRKGILEVDGSPIKFFHFSGFDSGAQSLMLVKYANPQSPLFDLREWYLTRLSQEGQDKYGEMACIYGVFSNAETVTPEHRVVYRERQDLQAAFPLPAEVRDDGPCYYSWFKNQWPLEKSIFPDIVAKLGTISNDKPKVNIDRMLTDGGWLRRLAFRWALKRFLIRA